MDKKIKVGVIGVGQMGYYHAQIYKKMPMVELAALCEYNDARCRQLQKEFQCKIYKNYKELLENPEIDAVSITLPDNMHRNCVEVAVANKKHILLEKPLAKKLEDGKALYEATKDYDKIFTVGFLLRFDPRFNMLKQSLDKGELGDIIHIYCRRNSPIIGPRRYVGASDLSMHVMIHDIDYINWFMGCQPIKVFAKARSVLLKENSMNDVIYAIVTYENNAIACMEACWTLPENSPTIIDDKVELVGTKGVAYVDSCDNGLKIVSNNKIIYPDTRHWYYVNNEVKGDLAEEIRAFVNNIAEGTKSIIAPKEAYDSLRVVDAIERSIKEGKEINL
ncbi:Oxidoreductase domain protein [Tepidanaerobacter acetatoxydans Re1]|uniref:Oxidoreductase domain protein n=1 Tax=Tepidanaerobacter acetatoxydans (strain DSM 21804 / JCM 16047 / Re1) TaxID=1209989 RepID=F4LR96_TEPAE|nr:Gfo/Idh/MocA family oxidoreductase [Tepidanaerobacter acetatoxydans]AEE92232.1 oxidoreductase domain protein [Tepidanaerobacter acetatoxydans Re1]CDI40942.1 Oxidoreductase domain protein [Tepidanaerobacter acetatoxydans Re1]